MFAEIGAVILTGLIVLKLYIKLQTKHCNDERLLQGKTVLITGANAGIGYETALDLARRRARVILACRDLSRGREAQKAISAATGNENVFVRQLDVSSFESVRAFVKVFVQEERQLHILINNAGIAAGKNYCESKDGIELVWATNHFGPFLLTMLLLDTLKKSAPSRIINVSSIAHGWNGPIPQLPLTRETYNQGDVYQHTKLANILFTRELSHRIAGTGVTVCSLHPGTVRTDLLHRTPPHIYYPALLIGYLFFKSPEEGAQTSIYCAVSDDIVSGEYYDRCQLGKASQLALDAAASRKLFEDSERITGKV